MSRARVGVVGFGSLGQYLVNAIQTDVRLKAKFELCFVWNRSPKAFSEATVQLDASLILSDLNDFESKNADVIVEVAHPDITREFGARFLKSADYLIGSPTAMADRLTEAQIREVATSAEGKHGLYIPCGALWGAVDIQRMADRGSLKGLTITMKKHPTSLKVLGELVAKVEASLPDQENIIFSGSVRDLCPLAPNNVNTMAAAAMAAHNLGFDQTQAKLVADTRLLTHVVDIQVTGPSTPGYGHFTVHTIRENPAPPGAVTGQATYASFVSSLLECGGRGAGVFFC